MDIHLNPQLTAEQQQVVLKYLRNPRALSKGEWTTALAASDRLGSSRVVREGKTQTFAQFYEDAVDRPYASAFIAELLTTDDVEGEGARRAETMGKQVIADLTALGLQEPLTAEQRLLAAYCLYWWGAFAKGYITEIAVFRDLTQSGIIFQAHDLTQLEERFSPDDLTIAGMRGDIKASTYFLHTTRHFPLRHDFYIATLFDPVVRQRRRVVIMQPAAWQRIDGDTQAAELEQAVALLPQPVAIVVKGQGLVVVEYNLWKEKSASCNRGVRKMSEQDETFSDLTEEEFQQMLSQAASPDFHDLAAEDFFTALAAIDTEELRETLELKATVKNGELTFLEPAPLYTHGNEIYFGDKRVVIKLVLEEASV